MIDSRLKRRVVPVPRRRDLLFCVLTANLAWLCAWGATRIADYVGTMNSARVVAAMMTARLGNPASPSIASPSLFAGLGRPSRMTPAERAAQELTHKQVGTVEVVLTVWRRTMWGLAGVLAASALLAAVTLRVRPWQLVAAAAILVSTVGTIIGMHVLVSPDRGGMPPLSPLAHILAPTLQALYGIILLLVFARKPQLAPAT